MSRQPFHFPEPKPLRAMALASIFIGVAFLAVALIPGFSNFSVGEKSLGWNDLWQTRVAIAVFVGGLLMLAIGFGIVHHQVWTRIALVVLPALQCLTFQIVYLVWGAPDSFPFDKGNLLGIMIWAFISSIYLYGFKAARDHFKGQGSAADD